MSVVNKEQLDREVYATARARGHLRFEAARRAGSEAKTPDALCHAAARLEAEPEVQAMIAAERARLKIETDDEWAAALVTMRENLTNGDPRVRQGAADFFAKLRGAFIQKHEHSGPDGGPITLPVHLMFGRPKGQGATLPPDPEKLHAP